MKILVAVHAADDWMLRQTLKQYQGLINSCTDAAVKADTYLFTEEGLSKVLLSKHFEDKLFYDLIPVLSVEGIVNRLIQLVKAEQYDGIVLLEDTFSNDIAGIAAARLAWAYATGVCELHWDMEGPRCSRFAYNNNVKAGLQLPCAPFIISLCPIRYEERKGRRKKPLQFVALGAFESPEYIVRQKCITPRKEALDSKVLIAAGRGVKTKAEIDEIRQFAKCQGFSFGVTRPVAMNAWGRIDEIIGVSGNVYAPKVCITIGVSGAAAFYAGIENSGLIISVNADSKAPIIGMSDVSIVEDYGNIVEKLFMVLERGGYGT